MDAGRREDLGQAVQELQSGEAQGGTAGGIGLGEPVEDLVGAAADEVEAFESEGWPGSNRGSTVPTLPGRWPRYGRWGRG